MHKYTDIIYILLYFKNYHMW